MHDRSHSSLAYLTPMEYVRWYRDKHQGAERPRQELSHNKWVLGTGVSHWYFGIGHFESDDEFFRCTIDEAVYR